MSKSTPKAGIAENHSYPPYTHRVKLCVMQVKRTKYIYLALGWLFTGLGFLGVFLPILPTTPFLLIAGWAFGNSSERLRAWLYNHPKVGPTLQAWYEHGAISRKAKALSFTCMSLSLAYLIYKGYSPYILIPTGLTMACVAAFVLTRPEPK